MKSSFFLFLFIVFGGYGFGQKAMTLNAAKAAGISLTKLDSEYKSALHADTSKAVFKKNAKEFEKAYIKMLDDFGAFLKGSDFKFYFPAEGFNRIYFSKDGSIDYYLFSFKECMLEEDQEKRFTELLEVFVGVYEFPMKAGENFSQCSPVTFRPQAN